jgi:hypothetical protein
VNANGFFNPDMAAKRRKKHKNEISGLVISICYHQQKFKFSLFTNPSTLNVEPLAQTWIIYEFH